MQMESYSSSALLKSINCNNNSDETFYLLKDGYFRMNKSAHIHKEGFILRVISKYLFVISFSILLNYVMNFYQL